MRAQPSEPLERIPSLGEMAALQQGRSQNELRVRAPWRPAKRCATRSRRSGEIADAENKSDPLDVQYGPSHPVSLMEGGLLRTLAGSDSVMVNSLHGQGIAKLAHGVSVEAVADDGLIEAFRVDTSPAFNLSVQWHPEWRVTENEFSMAIFKAFGDACRERASLRKGYCE